MNEIIKIINQFVVRDVLYILGGGSILASFAYSFGFSTFSDIQGGLLLFLAGIAYVVGYACQEFLSITPIITTSHFKPSKFVYGTYKRFTNTPKGKMLRWSTKLTNLNAFVDLYPNSHERQIAQIERTINLKQVGTTMGSAWLITAIILTAKAISSHAPIDIVLAISIGFLSLVLLVIGWVKGFQQMHQLYLLEASLNKSSQQDASIAGASA
ncbi:hypothetical protein [Neptuniibacter sp.]|uniref:hypothetical protein n=1 Tax=Neptuniibacter sp. TaxID=1962643 RepID=UPI003B5937CB